MSGHLAISQIRAVFVPIHSDGYKFVSGAALGTAAAFILSDSLGAVGLCATVLLAFFFRDPKRIVPVREGLVIAAADGTVIGEELALPPSGLGLPAAPMQRVSIFLSLLDVHVVRSPATGRIKAAVHRPGKFLNAAASEAPAVNECLAFMIETPDGTQIAAVLVAGTMARRIVPSVREGDDIRAGQRLGIIRFGSRTDIYLPAQSPILVGVGQRTIAGETVIADLASAGTQRKYEKI